MLLYIQFYFLFQQNFQVSIKSLAESFHLAFPTVLLPPIPPITVGSWI